MTTLEAWNLLTQHLAQSVPECKVFRCYDVATELTDIADDCQPRLYVQLEGVESTPIGPGPSLDTMEDAADFTLNLIWKARTSRPIEYDSLIPLVHKIANALRYRKFGKTGDLLAILNPSFGTDGELFDKDVLTDNGIFITTIGLQTKSRRTVK